MGFTRLKQEFDWRVQNWLRVSAPVVKRALKQLDRFASANAAQAERYSTLRGQYDLRRWPTVCSTREFGLNLYVLDLLDRYLGAAAHAGRGLDIGAAGWSYLPALTSWSRGPWDGVELDAHRRDWTLATRRAYAHYMMRLCPDCRYVVGSVLDIADHYARITWFLPFVRPAAFAAARLPPRYFAPLVLLRHAAALLEPGGRLFIVNQGEDEAAAQRQLCADAGLNAQALGQLESVFSPFTRPRYGWLVTRT